MGPLFSLEPPPADYPNRLAAPQPERLRLPSAYRLLALLVLLCLLPRAVMALRIPSVCPDGVLYIRFAEAIEAGNLRAAFQEMSLNVYPVILAALHHLGLDWELAATLWSVIISSLTILPLWGWARRQFDDRVALVACLLYVIHPKFIEWSPEAIRDPTFWFLFMLAIYWLWRAVTEVRFGYFIAAGSAMTLASLTRVEGLFLLIPWALWSFWRWLALASEKGTGASCRNGPSGASHKRWLSPFSVSARGKLLLGAVLCIVVFPALLAVVNVAWLYGHVGWASVRLTPLARAGSWLQSMLGHGTTGGEDALGQPLGLGRMLRVFFPTMTRGLSPVFALLMFGGIWGWLRVWARRDHQALFCTAVVIMGGIWVQLWYDKNIDPRYALPIVLMASPFAALGFLGLMARLVRISQRMQWGRRGQMAVVAATVFLIVAIDLGDAATSGEEYFETRQAAVDMGRWMHGKYAVPPVLVGPAGFTPVIAHYAHSNAYQTFRAEASDATILGLVAQSHADVVVLRPWKSLTPERCLRLGERMKPLGLEPVPAESLPGSGCGLYVSVRADQP